MQNLVAVYIGYVPRLSQLKILHLFIGLFKIVLVLSIESVFLGCGPQKIKQFDYCMILKKFTWTQSLLELEGDVLAGMTAA